MKTLYFLLLTWIFPYNFHALAQTENKSLNEFLILGTLKDYMGRNLDPRQENLLDRYDPSESVMKSIIDSLIRVTYPNEVYHGIEIGANTISSKFLADRFNRFYSYTESSSYTTQGKPILTGKLRDNIMPKEKEKLAFLAGAFLRFGSISDTAYRITIANSLSKANVCDKLLKELGCKPYYNIRRNYIPVGHDIFFHPTPKVLAYLNKHEKLRKRIEDSRNLFIQNMLNEARNKDKRNN
ncbi:hypothetical protein Pedsa_0032 [Pseudopedobacter saltans DSM 12145]|uniref:Uncharacterized protein n=1 Tax=Pseudopedobacter saltans (strain ATCC 51119 / DSM 12145 / JCM 21818 / CCUG 39354 / LMG 10337 / NBRC 100064 / NCIMB 13643) TaxID=762903 RepID=F0SC36_PSESL|nr:hypothetical protein [Pseudopedobacter saltans]ADY50621.1 hypothetical protein Pedsa_0032 [Pseudopedobacter saltans DSM 12145]